MPDEYHRTLVSSDLFEFRAVDYRDEETHEFFDCRLLQPLSAQCRAGDTFDRVVVNVFEGIYSFHRGSTEIARFRVELGLKSWCIAFGR